MTRVHYIMLPLTPSNASAFFCCSGVNCGACLKDAAAYDALILLKVEPWSMALEAVDVRPIPGGHEFEYNSPGACPRSVE